MKKLLFIISIILFSASSILAQEWHTNFDNAKEIAETEDRPILLVFQGSDWCAPCIKLSQEVFDTETFKLYAKDHYVLMEVDFPRKKKNALPLAQQALNVKMFEAYNKKGIFPLVILLDKKGNVLGETGYFKSSPSGYLAHLEEIKG